MGPAPEVLLDADPDVVEREPLCRSGSCAR